MMEYNKLKQKNVRIYEVQQRMLDEMLKAENTVMVDAGAKEWAEADLIRYLIGQMYKQYEKDGRVPERCTLY
jgi:hypothetical protein